MAKVEFTNKILVKNDKAFKIVYQGWIHQVNHLPWRKNIQAFLGKVKFTKWILLENDQAFLAKVEFT